MTPRYALIGLAAILAILAGLSGLGSCRRGQGEGSEIQAAIHQGEANAHIQQAGAIPDHAAELQSAKDDVARARAEVARVKRILEAQQRDAVPDTEGQGQALPTIVGPDPRDEVISSQGVLIQAQDGQIQALQLALSDEQRRSGEFKAAFEAERKATAAQSAATEAWKKAVTASRWQGRAEGFAAGIALGYVGSKR